MGLYDFSFYDLIMRNSVAFADSICWKEMDDDRQMTFADYKKRVDILALGLSQIGITKGDRLGVVGKNSLATTGKEEGDMGILLRFRNA